MFRQPFPPATFYTKHNDINKNLTKKPPLTPQAVR